MRIHVLRLFQRDVEELVIEFIDSIKIERRIIFRGGDATARQLATILDQVATGAVCAVSPLHFA